MNHYLLDFRPLVSAALGLSIVAGSAFASDPCSAPFCADETFGASGRVAVDFAFSDADRGNAVIRVPGEDRIYVIGQVATAIPGDEDFGVACLLGNGTPCPDFGLSGTTTVPMDFTPGGLDAAIAGGVVPWGSGTSWRLAVLGQVERSAAGDIDFGLALLRPDGSIETAAVGAGKVGVPFDLGSDLTDLPAAMAVDGQGRIVVGGSVDVGAGDSDWGFARLGADLSVDNTFGTGGRAVLDVAGLAVLHALVLQPDGKIIAVGSRDLGSDQMLIARLEANGSPDTSFGTLGQTGFDFPGPGPRDGSGWGVAIDPQGRYVIAGESGDPFQPCWMAARALPGGQPDTTFASGSAVAGGCYSQSVTGARAVAIFPDGYIVMAVETDFQGDHDYLMVHRTAAAANWTESYYPFDLGGTNDDRPRAVLIQPGGKIVVAGRVVGPGDTLDFGVLRVWSHQLFADGFESGTVSEWTLAN